MKFCDHITFDKEVNKNIVITHKIPKGYICKRCGRIMSEHENYTFIKLTKVMNRELPFDFNVVYEVADNITHIS